MAPQNKALKDPDEFRRFKAAMLGGKEEIAEASQPQNPEVAGVVRTKIVSARTVRDSAEANGAGAFRQTLDTVQNRSTNPTRGNQLDQLQESEASPLLHPPTSPFSQGLQPPVNTPQTRTSSPRLASSKTHDEDVGDALAQFVQDLDGRSLGESIWAPKHRKYQPSPLNASRSISSNLTPVRLVSANPETNESFSRMTFKIADAAHQQNGDQSKQRKPDSGQVDDASLGHTGPIRKQISPQSEDNVTTMHSTMSTPTNGETSKSSILECSQVSPKVVKVPPHLRGRITSARSSGGDHLESLIASSQPKAHSDTVQVDTRRLSFPDVKAKPVQHDLHLEQKLDNNNSPSVIGTATIGTANRSSENPQISLQHVEALEASGYFGDDQLADLQRLRERLLACKVTRTVSHTAVSDQTQKKGCQPWVDHIIKARLGSENKSQSKSDATRTEAFSFKAREPNFSPLGLALSKGASETNDTAKKPTEEPENREELLYFKSWGTREARDKPAARIRKVVIRNLPFGSTAKFIACHVFGGSLEEIHIWAPEPGFLTATIRFVNAEDCMTYYEKTANGIVYKKDAQNRELALFVELGKDVDVVGGLLQNWIDTGVTRCVRAVGVDEEWGVDGLKQLAEGKGRKLEAVKDSKTPGGARSVVFRFCKMGDAVEFKAALTRDEDWEHCNISFATDPCAIATGVHFD